MRFGIHMRALVRRRVVAVVSVALALVAALFSVDKLSLAPPGLTPRAVTIASSRTSVIVDTPTSLVVDLRRDTYTLISLENRAIVLGNVMASYPVLDYIAQRIHVPVAALNVAAPATPTQPAPRVVAGHPKSVIDIARYSNQYRLSIEANPTAPTLDIYAEAPTVTVANELADDAVAGLKNYMSTLGASGRIPARDQLRITQLGHAQGAIVNPGAQWQLAAVVFVLSFFVFAGLLTFAGRVRRGWQLGAPAAQHAGR